MSKKNLVLFSLLITLTLFLTALCTAQGITYFRDSTNDVFKYEDGSLLAKGDYANEIDVVDLDLIGIELTLNLAANPTINDGKHSYQVVIVWDSFNSSIQNKTEITVGNVDGAPFVDEVKYYLVNASGAPLATQPAPVYNSTRVGTNKLVWTMDVTLYEYSSYVSPEYVNVTTTFTTTEDGKTIRYLDTHLEGEQPAPPGIVWNFSTIVSLAGTLLVCGFAGYTLGQISVYYFTTNIRSKQTNTIFMAVFVIGLAALVNFWFWLTPWQILWNVAFFFLAIVFGYFWATRGLMQLRFDSPLPENLPIDTEEQLSACVILSKGEAEDYNPLPYIRRYHRNKELGVQQKGKFAQPLELFKIKQQYRRLLKQQAKQTNSEELKLTEVKNPYREISKELATALEESFLDFDMYVNAYVNDWPTINQVLLTVIARGANKITLLNLFTAECFEYHLAIEEMRKIDYSNIDLTIEQTPFLGKSAKILDFLMEKIKEKLPQGVPLQQVGVLLISEGQPKEWDKLYPLTEEETNFKKALAQKLQKLGLPEQNIRNAWLNGRSPLLEESAQELIDNGNCQTIIAVAVSEPIDGLNTLLVIPERLAKLTEKLNIQVLTIGGWNTDEKIIKTYLGLITEAEKMPLEELGHEAEIVLQSSKIAPTLKEASEEEKTETTPTQEEEDTPAKKASSLEDEE